MKSQNPIQGSASILIVLVMLALSVFGVLSMVSAYSDYKLSGKSTAWMERYFEMDTEALRAVAALNEAVAARYEAEGAPEWTAFTVEATTLALSEGWIVSGNQTLEHTVTRDTAHLTVELALTAPDENGRFYRVLRWNEWQDDFTYDGGLNVWPGQVVEE